jgi:hypothetical protein
MTVNKYSVTYNMILLSFVSTVLWFLVAVALVVRSMAGEISSEVTRPAPAMKVSIAPKRALPRQLLPPVRPGPAPQTNKG